MANTLGDQSLVEKILRRRPWLVGFTCYLRNIERTLWIGERLKERKPRLRILLGGPEITANNAWILSRATAVSAVTAGKAWIHNAALTTLERRMRSCTQVKIVP